MFGIDQPKVSRIVNGRLDGFSQDRLMVRQAPHMQDFVGFDRTEVFVGERDDRDGPAFAGDELHLVRIVAATEDDRSHIAGLETVA